MSQINCPIIRSLAFSSASTGRTGKHQSCLAHCFDANYASSSNVLSTNEEQQAAVQYLSSEMGTHCGDRCKRCR
mgnify:CR=1 FL=1